LIVVDSSALIAILLEEPGFDRYVRACAEAVTVVVGAPNVLETQMVFIGRHGPEAKASVDALLSNIEADVRSFLPEHAELATEAFFRFGRGQHRAKLNFGDCMAYAMAKSLNAPLLFKGGDFALTDVRPAL
jgi:ribonuclease VapC